MPVRCKSDQESLPGRWRAMSSRRKTTCNCSVFRIAIAMAFIGSASPVGAQSDQLVVELEFSSEEGCPKETAFMGEVEARIGRSIRWGNGDTAFRVRVVHQGDKFAGRLSFERSGEATTERDLNGRKCADVVS